MPNWCNNFVQISHEDPDKIKVLADAFNEGRFCDAVIPVPKELKDTVAGHLGEEYAQELNQFKMELNLKYFGAKDWYDFCVSRWGTKWDFGGDGYTAEVSEDGKHMSIGFDSAWSPPMGIYEELVEQGYNVDAMYYEPGMAFCGRFVDGYDNYFEISEMSSKEVADTIDCDVDEQFNISESIAEWEAENEEDLTKWVREGSEKRNLETL